MPPIRMSPVITADGINMLIVCDIGDCRRNYRDINVNCHRKTIITSLPADPAAVVTDNYIIAVVIAVITDDHHRCL